MFNVSVEIEFNFLTFCQLQEERVWHTVRRCYRACYFRLEEGIHRGHLPRRTIIVNALLLYCPSPSIDDVQLVDLVRLYIVRLTNAMSRGEF